MSLNGWGDLQIGRTVYRETWDAVEGTDGTARTLDLKGQEASPPNPRDAVVHQHDNLNGLEAGLVLPITFTDKPERNQYGMVSKASSTMTDWNGTAGGVVTATWSATFARCGTGNETDLQSRLTGAARKNDFSATPETVHAPPPAHYAYFVGPNAPGIVTRTGAEGAITVYRGIPAGVMPKWGCDPAAYGGARVRLLETVGAVDYELEGTDRRAQPDAWTLGNSLVRIGPADPATGTLNLETWNTTDGAYTGRGWDVLLDGTALDTPDSVTIVHNTYEHVIVRLTFHRTGPGRVSVDIGLRRGAPFAELYVQTGVAATIKVVRHSTEAGTQTSGYLTANVDDPHGNRYVIGSARTFTADTANGGLSVAAATVLDAFVGSAIGGSAAVSGNAAADLFAQYIGALPESVYAVRR